MAPDFDLNRIAALCEGYSNSDIKEMCRNAVMVPVKEAIRETRKSSSDNQMADIGKVKIRPVSISDFLQCMDSLLSFSSTTNVPIPAELD